jgi:hypothetical protein
VSCSVCAALLIALQHCEVDGKGKVSLERTSFGVIAEATGLRLLQFSVDPGEHLFLLVMLRLQNQD